MLEKELSEVLSELEEEKERLKKVETKIKSLKQEHFILILKVELLIQLQSFFIQSFHYQIENWKENLRKEQDRIIEMYQALIGNLECLRKRIEESQKIEFDKPTLDYQIWAGDYRFKLETLLTKYNQLYNLTKKENIIETQKNEILKEQQKILIEGYKKSTLELSELQRKDKQVQEYFGLIMKKAICNEHIQSLETTQTNLEKQDHEHCFGRTKIYREGKRNDSVLCCAICKETCTCRSDQILVSYYVPKNRALFKNKNGILTLSERQVILKQVVAEKQNKLGPQLRKRKGNGE